MNPNNMQINHAVRMATVDALVRLTAKKPFSAISVSELTQEAHVSRMSFYRNYSSMEEVFSSHMDEIAERYAAEAAALPKTQHFCDITNIEHCFQFFSSHQAFLFSLLQSGYGNMFLNSIRSYLLRTWNPSDDFALRNTLTCFSGALYAFFLLWSDNHFDDAPKDIASHFLESYPVSSPPSLPDSFLA